MTYRRPCLHRGEHPYKAQDAPVIECDQCKVQYALLDGDIAGCFVPVGWLKSTGDGWTAKTFCSMSCAVDYATAKRDDFIDDLHHGKGRHNWPEKAAAYAHAETRERGVIAA